MYDFWYTLGVATIDPTILRPLKRVAKFKCVKRVVNETIDGHPQTPRRGPNTGLVERDSTTLVRVGIAKALREFSAEAPPVGIYTGGRLCQLLSIPYFDSTDKKHSPFVQIINLSNRAYVSAVESVGEPSKMRRLPALLGLCLVDSQVAALIEAYPALPPRNPVPKVTRHLDETMLPELLGEFDISMKSTAWKLVRAYVSTERFKKAAKFMMFGDNNPWNERGNTLEQAIFWPDDASLRGEHVVP